MKRRFNINKLPKQYRDMIEEVIWNDGEFDDDILGEVWLKDGWQFDDESHCNVFTDRQDLIDLLKYETEEERN